MKKQSKTLSTQIDKQCELKSAKIKQKSKWKSTNVTECDLKLIEKHENINNKFTLTKDWWRLKK